MIARVSAFTSHVSIDSGMLVTCCICAMSVSLLLLLTACVSGASSVQFSLRGPWTVITLRENLVRLASHLCYICFYVSSDICCVL